MQSIVLVGQYASQNKQRQMRESVCDSLSVYVCVYKPTINNNGRVPGSSKVQWSMKQTIFNKYIISFPFPALLSYFFFLEPPSKPICVCVPKGQPAGWQPLPLPCANSCFKTFYTQFHFAFRFWQASSQSLSTSASTSSSVVSVLATVFGTDNTPLVVWLQPWPSSGVGCRLRPTAACSCTNHK